MTILEGYKEHCIAESSTSFSGLSCPCHRVTCLVNANPQCKPLAWHSVCNISSVAGDNAAPPERFSLEDDCFTYKHLLPFRLPQVPCSPQAQGTAPESLSGGSHNERCLTLTMRDFSLR